MEYWVKSRENFNRFIHSDIYHRKERHSCESRNPGAVPAKAGNQYFKNTGFPRIEYGAGLVKPGMIDLCRHV